MFGGTFSNTFVPPIASVNSVQATNGLLNNLVGYWGLDEAAGANDALDKHSNGLTLTQANSPGSAAGKVYAGARTFDGATQYFSRASETLLQLGGTSYAWSAWFYPTTSIASKFIVNKRQDGSYYYALRTDASGNLYFDEWAGGTKRVEILSTTVPSLNAWQMVTVIATRNSPSASKIFLGTTDITVGTPTAISFSADNTGALNIGRWGGGGNYFSGRIGPVVFWKGRSLDTTALTALYNAGAGLAYTAFTT